MITGENGEFLKPEIKALKDDVAKLENIRTLFMDAYKQASESFKAQSSQKDAGNGQKNNADAAANSVVFVKSMKDRDFQKNLVPYSIERKEMLLRDSRNIIAENVADIKSFVYEAFSNNKSIKSLHLGRITPELLNRIYLEIPNLPADKQNKLFRMDREYSLEIGQEDVRHLIDEKKQLTQEDIIDYVLNLPAIINNFDEVHYTQYVKGKCIQNGLLFRKQLADGKYFAMEIVSKGKSLFGTHNLYMDTADYEKKKKAIQTVPVPKAQGQTPKAPENSPSNIKITQTEVGVNNNSMQKLDNDAPKQVKSTKDVHDRRTEVLQEKRKAMTEEYRELKARISEKKASAEYVAFDEEIRRIRKNGSLFGGFEAVSKVREERKKWAEESGLTNLQERYDELSDKIHDIDLEIYKADKARKEADAREMTRKVKAFTESEISKYQTAASNHFGITSRFDNAGYLMGNGKLLDFSDGQGYRVLDHREIKNVLDFLPEGGNYSDGLIQFMNMGNIRMQIGGIDISKAPNKNQIPVLRKFFEQNGGEITVDFSRENGDNAGSIEYSKGTRSDRILNDIQKYFEMGVLPNVSTVAEFHSKYSTKDTSPIQAYYAEVLRENNNLKQIVTALDEMNYSSVRGNIQLESRDIFRIASKIIKQTSSGYDRRTLADELTALYDYMANSKKVGEADSETIFTSFLQIANGVLEQNEKPKADGVAVGFAVICCSVCQRMG